MLNKVLTRGTWRSWIEVEDGRWYAWVITSLALLATFVVADRFVLSISQLNQNAYAEPVILWQLMLRISSNPLLTGGAIISIVIVAFWQRDLCGRWQANPEFLPFKGIAILCTAILGWDFSSYSYNAFFDQPHSLDRMLLISLAFMTWWRPISLLPFVMLCSAIIWQFNEPIGGYSWAQHYMPLRLLVLFLCAFGLSQILRVKLGGPLLLVALCLVSSHYWVPGVGKYQLNWETLNSVSYLIPNTYSNGWLAMFSTDAINQFTQFAARFDPAIRFFVVAIEWGVLFCLWRRKITMLFLAAWAMFHFGVFTYSGIFFWKWIAIDGLLLYLLARDRLPNLFNPAAFLMSILMIAGSSIWFRPVNLAWLDVPINYSYRMMATTTNNQNIQLPPHFFAPYDYQFTLGSFAYLKESKHLGVVWGASPSIKVAEALYLANSAQDVEHIEATLGKSHYDPARREVFIDFVQRFATSKIQRGSDPLNILAPPRQLWTFPKAPDLQSTANITSLSVVEVLTMFNDGKYQIVREQPIVQIDLRQD